METRIFDDREISISNGVISLNGKKAGSAAPFMRYGYHPVYKLTFHGQPNATLVEVDTPLDEIFNIINKNILDI